MKNTHSNIFPGIFIFIIALLWGWQAPAQSPQQRFNQANHLYQEHRYDSASSIYRHLISQGYINPELYYNTGNACFKNGQLGYAVYYFEKALQQSPGNKVIKHNLTLAKQQATDKIDQVPTLFFIRWWHQLLHLHSPNGWMAGSIILFWLVVFFAGWRLLRRASIMPAPRWTKWCIIFLSILFCLYLSGAIGTWYQRTHHLFAVIIKTDEQVKTAPDDGSADILIIHEGLKVRVTDAVNEWRKIKLTDGKEGWVKANSMLDL